jgi:hypothetical protein
MDFKENDYKYVTEEMQRCQKRIASTIVSLILSIGLIGTSKFTGTKVAHISMYSHFGVLLCASLYISSLTFKIFRNAAFIQYMNAIQNIPAWEAVLEKFNEKTRVSLYETTAVWFIFLFLDLAYCVLYITEDWIFVVISFIILLIPLILILLFMRKRYYVNKWKDSLEELGVQVQ